MQQHASLTFASSEHSPADLPRVYELRLHYIFEVHPSILDALACHAMGNHFCCADETGLEMQPVHDMLFPMCVVKAPA